MLWLMVSRDIVSYITNANPCNGGRFVLHVQCKGDVNNTKDFMKYQVIESKSQKPVGKPYGCRKRARRRADKLDLDYGSIFYRVVEVTTK